MTVRRLLSLTFLALVFLAATVLTWTYSRSAPVTSVANNLVPGLVTPNPVQPTAPAAPVNTPEPVATPTEPPATEVPATAEVLEAPEPPALVEIPADLISTPTPDTPTVVPLPVLTNIPAVPRDGSVVYLTFDDGPDPVYTNQILDLLARYNAKATFFVLGNSVDAYPGVVQRMVAEGHALGNHTYYHEALPREEPEYVVQTLSATNAAIARAVGRTSMCLRPPYGALDQPTFDTVRGAGFTVHMWEVDSEDWKTNDSYTIASNVLASTSLGDRILFHDGPSNRAATVGAVESVLQVLSNRGVGFQSLSC